MFTKLFGKHASRKRTPPCPKLYRETTPARLHTNVSTTGWLRPAPPPDLFGTPTKTWEDPIMRTALRPLVSHPLPPRLACWGLLVVPFQSKQMEKIKKTATAPASLQEETTL